MARAVAYTSSFRFPISPWARAAEPGFVAQSQKKIKMKTAESGRRGGRFAKRPYRARRIVFSNLRSCSIILKHSLFLFDNQTGIRGGRTT